MLAARKSNQFTFIYPSVMVIYATWSGDSLQDVEILLSYFTLPVSPSGPLKPSTHQSSAKCIHHHAMRPKEAPLGSQNHGNHHCKPIRNTTSTHRWTFFLFRTELEHNSHRRWLKIHDLAGIYGSWERAWGKEGAEMREDVTLPNIALAWETVQANTKLELITWQQTICCQPKWFFPQWWAARENVTRSANSQ